jgi:hypothetical protein
MRSSAQASMTRGDSIEQGERGGESGSGRRRCAVAGGDSRSVPAALGDGKRGEA